MHCASAPNIISLKLELTGKQSVCTLILRSPITNLFSNVDNTILFYRKVIINTFTRRVQ